MQVELSIESAFRIYFSGLDLSLSW